MKKLLITTFAGLIAAATFCACGKDDDTGNGNNNGSQDALLSVDKAAVNAAYTAGTYQLQLTALQAWNANVNTAATWCTVSPTFFAGNHAVTVGVAENLALEAQRSATITFTAGNASLAVAVMQAGAPPLLTVEPAAIDAPHRAGTYALTVTGNVNWAATVNNEAAAWCTVLPATGAVNGTTTVRLTANTPAAARTAIVTFSAGTLTRTVTIVQAIAPPAPPHAASTQTWAFGEQTWSDAIHIPDCDKEAFESSTVTPQCRSYMEDGNTWYYYNWPYVNANGAALCPSPWRVPTPEDIVSLVEHASQSELAAAWGYGGYANGSGIQEVSTVANYWTDFEYLERYANFLFFVNDGQLSYEYVDEKFYGMLVRCVNN